MRLIIMFDLPSTSSKDVKNAQRWHKFLIRSGFIMMTESVYSRLVLNDRTIPSVRKVLIENLPPSGIIQLLKLTEHQYSSMEYLIGEKKDDIIDSNERYIEI